MGEGPCSATEGEERARENRAREHRPEEADDRRGGPGSWLDVGSTSCARPGHLGSDHCIIKLLIIVRIRNLNYSKYNNLILY